MARITVEDCLEHENNRFALVQLASKRTKQLLAGSRPLTSEGKGNKAVVTALREIADGAVRFMTPEDEAIVREREERMKELGLANPQPAPISAADDLFILPSVNAKEVLLVDDEEEDDVEVEELDDEVDDLDDADETDEIDDAGDSDDSDDTEVSEDSDEEGAAPADKTPGTDDDLNN